MDESQAGQSPAEDQPESPFNERTLTPPEMEMLRDGLINVCGAAGVSPVQASMVFMSAMVEITVRTSENPKDALAHCREYAKGVLDGMEVAVEKYLATLAAAQAANEKPNIEIVQSLPQNMNGRTH